MPIPVFLTLPMPSCPAEAASPYVALGRSCTFSTEATPVKNEYPAVDSEPPCRVWHREEAPIPSYFRALPFVLHSSCS